MGFRKLLGRLGELEPLTPSADPPFFFSQITRFPPRASRGTEWLSWPDASPSSFRALNEATVRVLRRNGCEVTVDPRGRDAAAHLHLHSGLRDEARKLARRNIDAVLDGSFDAIVTNAAGCGSTLKEYGELLDDDPEYTGKARRFAAAHARYHGVSGFHRVEPQHGAQ